MGHGKHISGEGGISAEAGRNRIPYRAGAPFTLMLESGSVLGWLFMGLAFAGIPFGWQVTGSIVGTIVGSLPVMLIAFMVRLAAAYLLGLFVYPVVLLYNLIRGCIHK